MNGLGAVLNSGVNLSLWISKGKLAASFDYAGYYYTVQTDDAALINVFSIEIVREIKNAVLSRDKIAACTKAQEWLKFKLKDDPDNIGYRDALDESIKEISEHKSRFSKSEAHLQEIRGVFRV